MKSRKRTAAAAKAFTASKAKRQKVPKSSAEGEKVPIDL